MRPIKIGKGTISKAGATRPPDKATHVAKAVLHHRVQHDRAKTSSAAREKYLRGLFGLSETPAINDDKGRR